MKRILPFFTCCWLLCFCGADISAQVTTAAINGKVSDDEGGPLIGANVLIVHKPTGTQYGVSTRETGKFNLPNLRVGGPYSLTVSYIGFQQAKIEDIYLKLGEDLPVNFTLNDAATELSQITITAEGSVIDSDRTGAATQINNEQLVKLPTISRSAQDIYRLTPAADGNSFGGRNNQFNNFSLDGSIFNNPFGLDAATPGGQTGAQPISLDAIDQIQVSLAPYDVTQSGFTGAAINAVTKSGTNEFHGTVFGFFRNDNMTGSKVKGREIIVPDLRQVQTGFSLGGYLIKDKLFFFTNFELERRQDLGSNFIAARPGIAGENVSRVTAADLETVSDLLRNEYGYETGPYEGYTHDTDNQKGIVKLDWNISPSHTLTATYNFLDASKDKPANPSAIGRRGPDLITLQFFNSGYQIKNKIQSGILELKSIFGNRYSNKLQVGYTTFRDSREPFSSPFPVININKDGSRYIVAGHEPFSINNQLNQKVLQITDNFNIYSGNHTWTIGSSLERFTFDNSFNLNAYGGTFPFEEFQSVSAFVDSVNNGAFDASVFAARETFARNNADNTWALAETNLGQWALYVQDKWAISPRFSMTLGLRMDMPLYFDTEEKIRENIVRKGGLFSEGGTYDPTIVYYDEAGQEVLFDHTVLPKQTPLLSPRVGVNYDVKGDRTLQLRGGTGLFAGRFPFVWLGNQVANPDFFFYTITDREFQFPQVWRTNIGGDLLFGEGWIATADIIYTKDINAMMVRNYGLNLPTATLNGADDRAIYPDDQRSKNAFGGTTNAYVFTNTDIGSSFNTSVELKRKWEKGLYTSLGYNYLRARDASSIAAEISSDAFDRNPSLGHANRAQASASLYGNRHRFVGSANKTFSYANDKMATTISLFFEYAEGGRFTYTYGGDINGDSSPLNDLIYIPTDAEIETLDFSVDPSASPTEQAAQADAQRESMKAFIAQDDYLSKRRGQYAEKYALLSPWYSRWDLRLLQDFKVGTTQKIQLSLDILNLGNLLSSNWGARQLPSNTQPIGVQVDGDNNPTYSFDTSLSESFTDDFSLSSRWQMQVGLRYIF